jgi:hypothetical protein
MAETPDRAGPTALTTSTATIVTAGLANTYTLIRKIAVTSTYISPITVAVGIGTSNTDTAAKRIFSDITVQPGQTIVEDGFQVLKGHASTPDLLYALVTGPAGATSAANIYVAMVTGP